MSKCERLSSARRMLSRIEKGRDFLSRVDEVVEIPPFDSVGTQQELILAALWGIYAKRRTPPGLEVSEAAIWLLSWLRTTDNFRTISKALKTVPADVTLLSYAVLSLGADLRREFEAAMIDLSGATQRHLETVLKDEQPFGISLRLDGTSVFKLERTSTSLLTALQTAPSTAAGPPPPPASPTV